MLGPGKVDERKKTPSCYAHTHHTFDIAYTEQSATQNPQQSQTLDKE
jgi:hypothetical protein